MKINTIKLKNFKRFKDDTIPLNGESVVIEGKNGEGKSTVRDAVFFAIFNKGSFGERDTDHYRKGGSHAFGVNVELDGASVERIKRSGDMVLRLNETGVSQQSISNVFPDFDAFASVFNVGYFFTLPESDQRRLILSLLPDTDKALTFASLGGTIDMIDKYSLDFDDLKKTGANMRKRLTRLEDKKKELLWSIERDKSDTREDPTPSGRTYDEIEKEKKDKEKKLAGIENAIEMLGGVAEAADEWKAYDTAIEEYTAQIKGRDSQKKDIEKRKAKLEKDYGETPEEMLVRTRKLEDELLEIERNTIPVPDDLICSVCSSKITKTKRAQLDKDYRAIRAKRLVVEGTIDNHRNAMQHVIKEMAEISLIEKMLQNDPLKPAKPESDRPEKAPENFKTLTITNARLSKEILDLHVSLSQIKEYTTRREQMEARRRSAEDNKAELVGEIADVRFALGLLKKIPIEEIKEQEEYLRNGVQSVLGDTVDIILNMDLKTGTGVKEVFRLTRNELEYRALSTGEKRWIDLGISVVIDSFIDNKVGVFFVDNAESVSDLGPLKSLVPQGSQVIFAKAIPSGYLKINKI